MSAARPPLAITPETLELRVGAPLHLRLLTTGGHAEVTWFRDGTPLAQDYYGLTNNALSIAAVHEQDQGVYHAVIQRGPFGGAQGNIPAAIDISEPAFVFVVPREEPEGEVACAICLSTIEHGADRFRFRRKAEESFHSGFRTLSPQGTFAAELQYCSHAFHKACVQSYAEHAIMRDGRWHVRCPGTGCAYHLYTSDVRELCGAASPAFTSFCELKTKDYSERVQQVRKGEDIDAETRSWMAANCDVCPGCQAIVYKDAGCRSITCTCDARFTHGEHRALKQ